MKLKNMFVPALVCSLMLGCCMAGSAENFIVEENSDGVVLNVQNTHTVELAVDGTSAFRVSVSYDGSIQAGKIDTIMVAEQKETASYQKVTDGDFVGIKTSFGTIQLNPKTNAFQMLDSTGKTISTVDNFSMYTPNGKTQRTLRGIASIEKCIPTR